MSPPKKNIKINLKDSLVDQYNTLEENTNLTGIPVVEDTTLLPVKKEIEIRRIEEVGENEVNEVRINEVNDDKKTKDRNKHITSTLESVNRVNEDIEERNNEMNELKVDMDNNKNLTSTLENSVGENEMSEARMNVMNDDKKTMDKDNDTTSIEVSVKPVNSNFNKETQERYSQLFANTKASIEEWYKSHDAFVKGRIETNLKVIGWMYERGEISVKQFNTAQEKLNNHFKRLLKGHLEFIKNKHIASSLNPVNTQKSPQPLKDENKADLSHENTQDNKTTVEDEKTQQEAIKVANLAAIERECKYQNKQLNLTNVDWFVKTLNETVADKAEKIEYINRYFEGVAKGGKEWYVDIIKKQTLEKLN